MISRLRGTLIEKKPPHILVEVGGLSYSLQAPMSTIFNLPEVGAQISVYTEFVVREDAHKLYAFLTQAERELFNKVTKVSGVGPKIALAILSAMKVEHFEQKIQNSEVIALTKIPGLGKKTAERLIIELRDKLSADKAALFSELFVESKASGIASQNDAKAALISLGYSAKDAHEAIVKILASKVQEENTLEYTSEQLIKRALAGLMRA
jgi:Holliday junction DNA helicase RuvA